MENETNTNDTNLRTHTEKQVLSNRFKSFRFRVQEANHKAAEEAKDRTGFRYGIDGKINRQRKAISRLPAKGGGYIAGPVGSGEEERDEETSRSHCYGRDFDELHKPVRSLKNESNLSRFFFYH